MKDETETRRMGETAFSQRDGRWAGQKLGACELTIGKAGCLITAASSMLVDWGVPTDPGRLNKWLGTTGGYSRGCLLIFASLAGTGADLSSLLARPVPMPTIADALAEGCGVLAMVDSQPGGPVQQHWVRLLKVDEDLRDCEIMDPWQLPGHEVGKLLEHYGAPGWDAARAIYAAAIYRRNENRVIPWEQAPAVRGVQEEAYLAPEISEMV